MKPSVWMKQTQLNEDPIQIFLPLNEEINFNALKPLIIDALKIGLDYHVSCIYDVYDDVNISMCKRVSPAALVPIPQEGEIGHEPSYPYYFDLKGTRISSPIVNARVRAIDEGQEDTLHHRKIQKLHVPSVSPSTVQSTYIKENQLDDNYYSPCANIFTVFAHCLAFETLPDVQSDLLTELINITFSDLKASLKGNHALGYCSQKHLKEEGITALLTVNISKCFAEYCCCQPNNRLFDRVSIMHQSIFSANKGDMDIALFYRFLDSDLEFVHKRKSALFPFIFIEFTKHTTNPVNKKLPQAALYANNLFRLMDFENQYTWVPLLGIVMSEQDILFRLYSPTLLKKNEENTWEWKIAEFDLRKCDVSAENIKRLIYIMVEWTSFCQKFLCSPNAKMSAFTTPSEHLFLYNHSNIVQLKDKIYKSFDYRELSMREKIDFDFRRDPRMFYNSELKVEMVVDWHDTYNQGDSLQIIRYDMVQGVHYPSYVGHMTQLIEKVFKLHQKDIVHGDLRFSNIVFSNPAEEEVRCTIIDFDLSGKSGERIYPPGFNSRIDDGKRHFNASERNPMLCEHDKFALQWICQQYQPENESERNIWKINIEKLENCNTYELCQEVISSLADMKMEKLMAVNKQMEIKLGIKGTGSPEAKRRHYVV